MKDAMELLTIYADGLDAAIDGRGWGAEHERARLDIVRACDSHDELVAALTNMLRYDDLPESQQQPAVESARSALAKAKGE